jgi:hypothetical protein
MHAAPSVTYPVGRSAFAGGACAALVAAALAACFAWSLQAPLGWRQGTGFLAVLACGALALHGWWHSPAGSLRWDGLAWTWEEGGRTGAGQPAIALDLQARLLLRWRPDAGPARWLWLERASDTSHWDALRRAVYSRASPHAGAAGKPPAAEQ